jgi:transcriptional regulator with XRE-family HTH domain
MKPGPSGSFGAQLKALREAAGYTQEELATAAAYKAGRRSSIDALLKDIDGVRLRQHDAC